MFFGILGGIALILMILAYVRNWSDEGAGLIAFLVVVVVVGGIILVGFNCAQQGHIVEINKLIRCEKIYQDRKDNVLSQVQLELNKYPSYEKGMIESVMTGAGKGQLINMPPALKANETIIKSTEMIVSFNDAIYNNRIAMESERAAVEMNSKVGPWIVPFVMKPKVLELAPVK